MGRTGMCLGWREQFIELIGRLEIEEGQGGIKDDT